MKTTLFGENIKIRTEPGLRDALHAIAGREKTTISEFLRRELRLIVAARSAEHGGNDGSPRFPPAARARIAA